MDDKLITKNLLYFVDIVSGDIDALEKIALAAEEEDQKNAPTTQPLFYLPAMTTSSHGYNLVNKVYASRCTIPLTMLCFSVLDFLGKLCVENLKKELDNTSEKKRKTINESSNSMSKDGFASHASIFFKNLANNEDLKNPLTAKFLQDSYRHSIAHSFLSVPNYIVSYSSELDKFHQLFVELDNKNILNVRYLAKIVKKGLETFRNQKTDNSIIINNYRKEFEEYGL